MLSHTCGFNGHPGPSGLALFGLDVLLLEADDAIVDNISGLPSKITNHFLKSNEYNERG